MEGLERGVRNLVQNSLMFATASMCCERFDLVGAMTIYNLFQFAEITVCNSMLAMPMQAQWEVFEHGVQYRQSEWIHDIGNY